MNKVTLRAAVDTFHGSHVPHLTCHVSRVSTCHTPSARKNIVQPQCKTRSKTNLNIICVLIIVAHAQGLKWYEAASYLQGGQVVLS